MPFADSIHRMLIRRAGLEYYTIFITPSYELKAELSAAGHCVENNDLWIAACAVRHSLPLITNNRSHFEKIPRLSIISEGAVIQEINAQRALELD